MGTLFMSCYMARFTNWSAKYSELSGMSGASEDRSVDHTLNFGHSEANERDCPHDVLTTVLARNIL
uniref:Uncharacterized protein n=1 Tax=Anguilla anguilla TaxID=7936 RepID=A0A0E9W2K8_ANGAN